MIKKVLWIVFVGMLFFTLPATAQEENHLARVFAQFWPEYDKPEMLVMYDITLPANTRLPATVTIKIPAAAGEPSAVASRQPDNSLVNLNYDPLVKKGDWLEVTFDATTLESRVEFYDPGLEMEGSQRTYNYIWPGDHLVDSFQVEVQQPLGASNVLLNPSMGEGVKGNDGMMYYLLDAGVLSLGEPFQFTMKYDKESDSFSSTLLKVEPSQPINSATTFNTLSPVLPWLMFGLGLLLIAGGGIWYWRSGRTAMTKRKTSPESHRRRKAASQQTEAVKTPFDDGGVYCQQCGKRASSGDRFCRICGTQLRV